MAEEEFDYSIRCFSKKVSKERKNTYIFFLVYFIILVWAEVWPIFLIGNRVRPYVLGLPFSMFWTAAVVMAGFVGMLFLYNFDVKGGE